MENLLSTAAVTNINSKKLADFMTIYENKVFITYQPMYIMGRASNDHNLGLTADEYYNVIDTAQIDKMKGDAAIKRES